MPVRTTRVDRACVHVVAGVGRAAQVSTSCRLARACATRSGCHCSASLAYPFVHALTFLWSWMVAPAAEVPSAVLKVLSTQKGG
jgi:hypothetical protein